MTLDVEGLTQAIRLCFANARDTEHFSAQQRQDMLFRGKILRGHLVNLISAHFSQDAGPAITDANAKIAAVNNRLKSAQETLQQYADSIDRLSQLAKNLEELLVRVSEFV